MKRTLAFRGILVSILVLTCIVGCAKNEPEQPQTTQIKVIEVQRGDLFITVTADGSLEMPHTADMRFGTAGTVKQVYVEEGDEVKAGTLLAKLDDTAQKVSVESAEYDVQIALNALALSIPGCQQLLGYPRRYPNETALLLYEQAQSEVHDVLQLLSDENYGEALSVVRLAQYDLESSIKLHEVPLTDTENYPDIARAIAEIEQYPNLQEYYDAYPKVFESLNLIRDDVQKLKNIQSLLEQGKYTEALDALMRLEKSMNRTHIVVEYANESIERRSLSFPDVHTSIDYLNSAEEILLELQNQLGQGDIEETGFMENLRKACHDLETSLSILISNELVAETGLSLKNYQDYNLDLKTSIATLRDSLDDLTMTELLAPFDATVVSVEVKEDDQLSARDYSSRSAVLLVDTSRVYFEGVVDEIDILQVREGQRATILVDALPDTPLTGVVNFISPASTQDANVVNYTVTIDLDPTDIELKGGLTATAEISIDSREDVLLIPSQAIIKTSQGTFTDVVIDEETMQTERREITIGLSGYQFSEVISGIEAGEKVIAVERVTPTESGRGGFRFLRP
jgi:RND family efflux transporter MFP subunit